MLSRRSLYEKHISKNLFRHRYTKWNRCITLLQITRMMYTLSVIFVLCVLAGDVHTQQMYDPHFEINPRPYLVEGESLTMKCTVNMGVLFLAETVLRISHRNGKTGIVETITDQANMVSKYEDLGCNLDFRYDPIISVTLTIPSVTADFDGEFLCQVKRPIGDEILEAVSSGTVTVMGGVDRVVLTVGEKRVVKDNQMVQFKGGKVSVGCQAFGSNPSPVIALKIGSEPITGEMNVTMDTESSLPRRSYKGAVTAILDYTPEMFGRKLSCDAGVDIPTGVTAEFPIVSSPSAILFRIDGATAEVTIKPESPIKPVSGYPSASAGFTVMIVGIGVAMAILVIIMLFIVIIARNRKRGYKAPQDQKIKSILLSVSAES